MEAIRRQAVLTFARTPHCGEIFEKNLNKLHSLMSKITSDDVSLDYDLLEKPKILATDKPRNIAPVTYVEILENTDFTINMFILRDGSCIPLHDHPLMHGILKVVHGKVSVKSFSITDENENAINDGKLLVKPEDALEVGQKDDAIILRHHASNLHEIRTIGGPAAFVDVLAPPYESLVDGKPRLCHYYEEDGLHPNGLVILKRTLRQEHFWTDLAPYLGPPLEECESD